MNEEEYNRVNNSAFETYSPEFFEENPKFKAHLDAMSGKYKFGLDNNFYEHVCNIEADSLDEVFEVGNIGPEEKIYRLRPMHSISVGDLIVDPTGNMYVVASFGFDKVET
jgi:hypothetical protein